MNRGNYPFLENDIKCWFGIRNIVKSVYHLMMIAIVEVVWFFRKEYILNLYRDKYRGTWKRKIHLRILKQFSDTKCLKYILSLPEKEKENYFSSSSWSDSYGVMDFYDSKERVTSSRVSKEEIGKLGYESIKKHSYPLYLAFEYILHGMDVADYGCVSGRIYHSIKDSIGQYVGFDISKESIEEARRTYPAARDSFIYVESFDGGIYGKPTPFVTNKSVALLSYILCHLTYKESIRLIKHCTENHDTVVVAESITKPDLEAMSKGLNWGVSERKINVEKALSSFGFKLGTVLFHPTFMMDSSSIFNSDSCVCVSIFRKR